MTLATFPPLSVAVHVTIVIPRGNFCGELFVIDAIPVSSVAVACPMDIDVSTPDASTVMSAGAVILGGVLSLGFVIIGTVVCCTGLTVCVCVA